MEPASNVPEPDENVRRNDDAAERLRRLLGQESLERLRDSTVLVFGLGGVGSNCVEALARGGIGHLVLIDSDFVQESDINRQAIALHSTLGQRKVDAMRAMVADINPQIEVRTHDMRVLVDNVDDLLDSYRGQLDYVVDAIDTIATKLAIARYAQRTGLTLVSSMGAANKVHPEYLRFADLYDTYNCPLSRLMRKLARQQGITHLRVLYSTELPIPVPAREGATRDERSNLGTASFMPSIMGHMLAGAVIRELSGIETREEADRLDASKHPANVRPSKKHEDVEVAEPEEVAAVAEPAGDKPEEPEEVAAVAEPAIAEKLAAADGIWAVDMHCHLDFLADIAAVADELRDSGIAAFSATVTPDGYRTATSLLGSCSNVRVGLGMHPWWIADGTCGEADIAAFEELAAQTAFIGEVGLDFGRHEEGSRDAQIAAFERIARACCMDTDSGAGAAAGIEAGAGAVTGAIDPREGKVITLHAVHSATTVLDILESTGCLRKNTCIFHWFSGSTEEMQRAIAAGCLFSVGPHMLGTRRGRAYVRSIPVDRLLLETDAPDEPGLSDSAIDFRKKESAALLGTLQQFESILGRDVSAQILANSLRILKM